MKRLVLIIASVIIATPAMAGSRVHRNNQARASRQAQKTAPDAVLQQVAKLQAGWARASYKTSGKSAKLNALHRLEKQAASLTAAHRHRGEPKVWEAIILATDAGISGGFSALGKVKKARRLLLASLKNTTNTMKQSALTSLGSLYYQVPGWPIAFGDNAKAEKYLKRALRINPRAIDPNYFYGDYLQRRGRKARARKYLKRALNAPARPGRTLADAGRRRTARKLLKKL